MALEREMTIFLAGVLLLGELLFLIIYLAPGFNIALIPRHRSALLYYSLMLNIAKRAKSLQLDSLPKQTIDYYYV